MVDCGIILILLTHNHTNVDVRMYVEVVEGVTVRDIPHFLWLLLAFLNFLFIYVFCLSYDLK